MKTDVFKDAMEKLRNGLQLNGYGLEGYIMRAALNPDLQGESNFFELVELNALMALHYNNGDLQFIKSLQNEFNDLLD